MVNGVVVREQTNFDHIQLKNRYDTRILFHSDNHENNVTIADAFYEQLCHFI